ncbi:MAG: hypothetical protein V9G22_15830 [Ottowia sp.]
MNIVDSAAAYSSLVEMRAAHRELLRESRAMEPLVLPRVHGFIARGRATGARIDGEAERGDAQSLLDYWVATLLRSGTAAGDVALDEFDPEQAPELGDELCPYVGLDAFVERDRERFFGRDAVVDELVERLREKHLVVVAGPSGSGKSSIVLAGLLPRVRAGALPGSASYRYCETVIPGAEPLTSLAIATCPSAVDAAQWVAEQSAGLRARGDQLIEMARLGGDAPLFLIVDRFEEVFTLCTDSAARDAFAANLAALASVSGGAHRIVVTVRIDFLDRARGLAGLCDATRNEGDVVIPLALGARELREAIERPAARAGLRFEEGLVDQLTGDVLGEPAALPLLQFTLLKLWRLRRRNRVTWEAYRRLGGPRQALQRAADELYDSLIPRGSGHRQAHPPTARPPSRRPRVHARPRPAGGAASPWRPRARAARAR